MLVRGAPLVAVLVGLLGSPLGAWDWLWTHQLHSSEIIDAYGGAADAAGSYVVGGVQGEMLGTTAIGAADAYIRKFDHAGNVLWTRRFGTTADDVARGVSVDGYGAAFVGGITCGAFPGHVQAGICDIFVVKFDAAGSAVWVSQFGTPHFEVPYQYGAIAVDATGVYVAGKTLGTFPGEAFVGAPDAFLARLDPSSGAVGWIRQFAMPDVTNFDAGGVAVDETGIAIGAYGVRADGLDRSEVRKYAVNGDVLWAKVFDNSGLPCAFAVFNVASHAGNVYVVGQTNDSTLTTCTPAQHEQTFVVGILQKLDSHGDFVWRRRIKGGRPDQSVKPPHTAFTGAKVVHASDLGVIVGANIRDVDFAGFTRTRSRADKSGCGDPGSLENVIFADFDAYVRRYDHDGNVIWTHQFGSGLYDLVSGLGAYRGAVYAAGTTRCVLAEDVGKAAGSVVDGFFVKLALDPQSSAGRIQLIVGRIETLSDAERVTSDEFRALTAHLETSIDALDRSQTASARNALHAFVELVDSLKATGRLSAADADPLRTAASVVGNEL
jgi:hypothetical protein